jgi:peptidoglycan-N-acetylglucosamine deacetylase
VSKGSIRLPFFIIIRHSNLYISVMRLILTILLTLILAGNVPAGPRISITIDDPHISQTPLYDPFERNRMILDNLAKYDVKAALFVCGMRVDSDSGRVLLDSWNNAEHLLCNHSYSHLYYPSKKITPETFEEDFFRGDSIVNRYSGFAKVFRFPYLKEGNDSIKRDHMRNIIKWAGYKNGHVSIDASDWYIEQRMLERLKTDPGADLTSYRDFYLQHIKERAEYYNELAKIILGREPDHVLLLHHNLLNALFLDDLLDMFKANGWDLIDADTAYEDSLYSLEPGVLPAGESIIWSLAKETGEYDTLLRYPAEDGEYEKEKMDELGL